MTDDGAVNFSNWIAWAKREDLAGVRSPGIYVLAIADTDIAGESFGWRQEIAYIGMSNSLAGLRGRLQQFDNTIAGKTGHGGAQRFMHDHPEYDRLASMLWVAVWPFACNVARLAADDLRVMGEVARAEYECLARFKQIYGRLPKYNDKKNSPKAKSDR